jgi:hypothetical protein
MAVSPEAFEHRQTAILADFLGVPRPRVYGCLPWFPEDVPP